MVIGAQQHLTLHGYDNSVTSVGVIGCLRKTFGSGGIRTHASGETGALNQRLRPLGHATSNHIIIKRISSVAENQFPRRQDVSL